MWSHTQTACKNRQQVIFSCLEESTPILLVLGGGGGSALLNITVSLCVFMCVCVYVGGVCLHFF